MVCSFKSNTIFVDAVNNMTKTPQIKVFAWYDKRTYPREKIIDYIKKNPKSPLFEQDLEETRIIAFGHAKNDNRLQKSIVRQASKVLDTSDGGFFMFSPDDGEDFKEMLRDMKEDTYRISRSKIDTTIKKWDKETGIIK